MERCDRRRSKGLHAPTRSNLDPQACALKISAAGRSGQTGSNWSIHLEVRRRITHAGNEMVKRGSRAIRLPAQPCGGQFSPAFALRFQGADRLGCGQQRATFLPSRRIAWCHQVQATPRSLPLSRGAKSTPLVRFLILAEPDAVPLRIAAVELNVELAKDALGRFERKFDLLQRVEVVDGAPTPLSAGRSLSICGW